MLRAKNNALLSLGSNIGSRLENLFSAIDYLSQYENEVVRISPVYETEPYGVKNQPQFLNALLDICTYKSPLSLLRTCKEIETKMGRKKHIKWGERNIDIDIIYFSDVTLNTEVLTIPHADMHNRLFVLKPMEACWPHWQHPIFKLTATEMIKRCESQSSCNLIKKISIERWKSGTPFK